MNVAVSPLSASVLVLNRLYMAVHVVGVRRALGLLFRELAEVIHVEEGQYANYDFHSWREVSELKAAFKEPHQDWIRAVKLRAASSPRHSPARLPTGSPSRPFRFNRRNIFARDGNRCQYLRSQVPHERAQPRPRDAAQPRRRHHVGEHRVQLREVQRSQRGAATPQEAHMHLIASP